MEITGPYLNENHYVQHRNGEWNLRVSLETHGILEHIQREPSCTTQS
jgi:hypothetical protein